MALKRRKAEASKDAAVCSIPVRNPEQANSRLQSEYAQILAKRLGEAKAAKTDARSKSPRRKLPFTNS